MGVSYMLRCTKCYAKVDELEDSEVYESEDYDEIWEELYEKLDPDFGFSWGEIGVGRLIKWVNEHKEHGAIEFTAE